nr:alpha/beta hydrolase [Pseudovibrio stylochi]
MKTAFLLGLPFLASAALAAPTLEKETQLFIEAAHKATPLYTLSYEDARSVLDSVQQEKIATAKTSIQDTSFPVGPTGNVAIRIIRPQNASGKLPVILYLHGGGWVMGNRNTHDNLIQELSAQTGAAVVFVEYENAPELKYPDNNEQAYAALEYVSKHGHNFGLDSTKIAVAGDSAGGNMAAAITLMAKERKGPTIKHQLLFYPVTSDISENESYTKFGEGPFLTKKAMEYFLKANYPEDRRNEVLAFPLLATDEQLQGLPSATIIVAENDLLRDEGEAYARKLANAGVQVTSTRYNGTIHDFVMLNALAKTPAASSAISQAATELKKAFSK